MDTAQKPAPELDKELCRLAASGDISAFNQLMRRHNQRIYRAARSILHNEMEAEDATQEAWWKIYNHLADFRAEAQATTWMTRIAINEALVRLRRNKKRATLIQAMDTDENFLESHAMQEPETYAGAPDEQLLRGELRALLERQIDNLPEKYRSVFMLRGIEGMASAEVAEILDIPEATVRVRFMRARRLLQQKLELPDGSHWHQAFSFAGERCDRIVAGVHQRLRAAGVRF